MKKGKVLMGIVAAIILSVGMVISYKAVEKNIEANRKTSFHKCMNIGNALESPKNIPWDLKMKAEYFHIIRDAGFDSVRFPVRFSDYADKTTYVLDEQFMNTIDNYINYALNDNLTLILDMHHFEEIMEKPEDYKDMFLSIWDQLSSRYAGSSDKLVFELLNEPKDNLRGELWNEYLKNAVEVIRSHDKKRKIIVGPDSCYSVERLYDLIIPDDKNLILTFHYYEPETFTFQGDSYHKGYENLKNIKWNGTDAELKVMDNKFDIAKKYSKENKIPVFLGEFGVNKKVKEQYRYKWIESVRTEADSYNFSWAYWEFASNFGIYNLKNQTWGDELKALIP
ncbi:MAG: glycoside hydrolase family 5 protein [Clostridium butyricum]|nr:glycoside hydrolase family 5 protein [Clostridium butyricum]